MGSVVEAHIGSRLGAYDSGPSRTGWTAWHQAGYGAADAFLTDLAAEVKKASDAGKCFDPATKDVRLPKYGTLAGYEQNIEWNIHRWCGYYGRGI